MSDQGQTGGMKPIYGLEDKPAMPRTLVLSAQHVLTMFPATVLVALLVGFDVATVLFASGMATVVALILSKLLGKKFIPLYYCSSFSYIAATLALTGAEFGMYAGEELVRLAQVGIVATGTVVLGAVAARRTDLKQVVLGQTAAPHGPLGWLAAVTMPMAHKAFYGPAADLLQLQPDDELVEVTPEAIRIRKIHLLEHERKRASRQKDEQ